MGCVLPRHPLSSRMRFWARARSQPRLSPAAYFASSFPGNHRALRAPVEMESSLASDTRLSSSDRSRSATKPSRALTMPATWRGNACGNGTPHSNSALCDSSRLPKKKNGGPGVNGPYCTFALINRSYLSTRPPHRSAVRTAVPAQCGRLLKSEMATPCSMSNTDSSRRSLSACCFFVLPWRSKVSSRSNPSRSCHRIPRKVGLFKKPWFVITPRTPVPARSISSW